MRPVSAKFVPLLLTDGQKENRVEISQEQIAVQMAMKTFLRTS